MPLRDGKNFSPRPKNSILIPPRGSSQNFQWAPLSFLYESPPLVLHACFLLSRVDVPHKLQVIVFQGALSNMHPDHLPPPPTNQRQFWRGNNNTSNTIFPGPIQGAYFQLQIYSFQFPQLHKIFHTSTTFFGKKTFRDSEFTVNS